MNLKQTIKFVSIACLWLLTGCNKVYDIQDPDTETVPEATITAIKSVYPDAGKFVFKTLVRDKLWKARFVSMSSNFETQVSPTAIVSQVYKESKDITLYKGLTDKLKVKGGEISDLQLIDKDLDNGARMKYALNGKSYLLTYYTLNDWHILKLTGTVPVESFSIDYPDLPENIKTFCEQKAILINDGDFNVNVDINGKKTYYLYPQAQLFPIIFNDNGELTWIAQNADGTPIINKPNNEVGNSALLSKVSEGYADFTTPADVAFEAEFDGVKSVRYVLQKKSGVEGTRTFVNELREVFVNAISGEIIYDQYSSYVFK